MPATTRRIFHILFCATRRLTASAWGCRYVHTTTTMSRTNERASERTNVTAGGCLRNPLSCYTLRPSIAARTKNTVPCLAAPSASGVNILSTLFFHRTSRTLSPPWSFRFSRSSFSFPPRSRYTEGKQAAVRSFAHFPDLKASSSSPSSSSRW